MKLIIGTLQRVQQVLPKSWQKKVTALTSDSTELLAARSGKLATTPFSTSRFPAIDWAEADSIVAQDNPLAALDQALQSSPNYGVLELPDCLDSCLANNPSQACEAHRLAPKPPAPMSKRSA